MGRNPGRTGFDDYAAKLIRYKARQLVGKAGITADDCQDVEQDLTLHLLQQRHKFDPMRSGFHTYVSRIVDRKIASILRWRSAAKRDWRVNGLSLNAPVESADREELELGDTIRTEDPPRDLPIDLQRAIDNLPPNLRTLCERLGEESVSEVAVRMAVSRATVHARIGVIRRAFRKKGLHDYLA